MATQLLNVALCWHMHQPYYREGENGDFHLPWVYLHGIKDYTDMATHLENHPKMSACVNFSPILLQQLDDYVQELAIYVDSSNKNNIHLSDPLLGLLAGVRELPTDINQQQILIEECKRCYAPRMIEPYPIFHALLQKIENDIKSITTQDIYDLLVWYHLVWMGYSLKQTELVQNLMQKAREFNEDDRHQVILLIHQALGGIIPRYRRLAERGQVELSFTPYAHPIVPLLNDFSNMNCSLPDAPRPNCENYPQGQERSRWHIEKGIQVFEHYFGRSPEGAWLSEGGVSPDAIRLLEEYGIKWTASGENVWANTCHLVGCQPDDIHTKRALSLPYQYQDCQTKIYFRDDGLSDFIGFEYSHWNAEDAAQDFVGHLQNIANFLGENADKHVISIILDGENAWEYYLDNGYHFLNALYHEMTHCEAINLTNFSNISDTVNIAYVDQLCSGSWVYGSFSTWIGQVDKNRAWEYLVAAKKTCDEVIASGNLSPKTIQYLEEQLAICEGSDWFWWFGDYNPSNSVHDFDELFRIQLKKLYALIQINSPAYLEEPISHGGGNAENAGTMRRNA